MTLRAWWSARRRRRLEARVRRALARPGVAADRRLRATARAVRRDVVRALAELDLSPEEREAMRRAADRAIAWLSNRPVAVRSDEGRGGR